MKHRVAFRKLNRTSAHREAMLRTMVTQLIEHERIRTTLPKAKELRRVAEKVVTMAKQGDEPARKRAQSILRTPEAVTKLFDVVGPRYALREGGYTRILKADFRKGDGAEMAVIEYVDRPGEMRKAKPPTGIEAARAVFEAQAESTQ
ncbi:ribosomal protein L17 [Phytophthora nicotianae CJ01A1]|uniref:Large ribosomal subunit protein bL17c n=6 Tax=Phytophthora nicotianae TaxID=4792 RepID=W2R946_PHYN3|nr:ribosomal protein L17 [Phytophthora nicotianae INRA-310]ETI44738.1 ribosomal protein L17 [Phytophthora nicotianae P1569]ETK84722.1 ribosomal protein L17 [Phytophthora nicotianae]ETO73365.1 ribosomal protein L17 [Phytophthora nicotianae P1976]ETP14548.1 ribosomal protein L17 [Phytophthora nicotianae CJ01A1]ETP42628.1 ribosomal protein L17 [Phytophthora nicotianae P10297]KUF78326.1 50S ribosomal protein L17 [Phytophthora nicotianae]